MGGDCYACPIHGWDWMKSANDYLMQEYELEEIEAESILNSQLTSKLNR